ncbi:MAG: thioredoxin domain-containing protein [Acidobacteriota bacterium]
MNCRAITLAVCGLAVALCRPVAAEVVASGKNLQIDRRMLEEAAASDLEQLELERLQFEAKLKKRRQQILEAKLKELVGRQLLTMEAAARGVKPQELFNSLAEEVDPPTSEEVEQVYTENESRFNEPKEKVLPRLEAYLKQEKTREHVRQFIDELAKKYGVEYHLEPLRFEVGSDDAPALGPAGAPVEVVEFSDFECPYCAEASSTVKRLREEFGDQVRVVFRQFPIAAIHRYAQKAAEASLCAAEQGKFWEMHDAMFQDQQHLDVAALKAKARELGLDGESFDQCLDSGKYAERVRQDLRDGVKAGVDGTPAFFVNGRPFGGAVAYEKLAAVVREELEAAHGAAAGGR